MGTASDPRDSRSPLGPSGGHSPGSTDRALPVFEVLYDVSTPEATALPQEIVESYGPFAFDEDAVYLNFVSSLDGVVAISELANSPRIISGASEADRMLMGLLRALADVVVVGAGTANASPRARFTPEHVYPPAAELFVQLRERLGKPPRPAVAIVTGRGHVSADQAAVRAGAFLITGAEGARRLRAVVPHERIVELDVAVALTGQEVVAALRERGYRAILSEGGPHLVGDLLRAGVVGELFLTLSPTVVGRSRPSARFGLVEEADLLAGETPLRSELVSLRRSGAHLFLRYRFGEPGRPS